MAEPGTPLPSSKASGEDEASVLLGYLTYHRTVLARKAEGLSDEQARRPACPPSALTLLGLIRHMTDVERWRFGRFSLAEWRADGRSCLRVPPRPLSWSGRDGPL